MQLSQRVNLIVPVLPLQETSFLLMNVVEYGSLVDILKRSSTFMKSDIQLLFFSFRKVLIATIGQISSVFFLYLRGT